MIATLAAQAEAFRDAANLVVHEYLPELLVIGLITLIYVFIRSRLSHASRPRR